MTGTDSRVSRFEERPTTCAATTASTDIQEILGAVVAVPGVLRKNIESRFDPICGMVVGSNNGES